MTFLLLTKVREYIKRQRTEKAGNPEHILLLEEAHNLVGRNLGTSSGEDANTKQEAANYVTRMLAEMRALREAIIIADQLPTGVAAEVVKNTNVKIAHRLVSADDRKDIGQAMLLDQSQMEEIARLQPGESFLYMEGWYRPHPVKIPYENSAKEKLGVESSITNDKIKHIIKSRPWYIQGQQTLLSTALQEYQRLYKQHNQSLTNIREELNQVSQNCTELQVLLSNIKQEIFHRLAGELRFDLNPVPDELSLQIDRRIDANNIRSLKYLQLAANLTLTDLVELQSLVNVKLGIFDQFYQKVLDKNNQIRRSHYQQLWQKLSRQMKNTQQQIINLAQVLNRESQVADIQKLSDNLAYEQRRINDIEESSLKDTLKRLQNEKQELQDKLTEVLSLAIQQAKINKVKHDLQI